MPDKWMTVAAAAATLNIHPRTDQDAASLLPARSESRRTDDEQLQVQINAPDDPPAGAEAFETVRELAQDQVSLATGSASALVKFAQDDAHRAPWNRSHPEQDAGRARQERKNGLDRSEPEMAAMCLCCGGVDDLQNHPHDRRHSHADPTS